MFWRIVVGALSRSRLRSATAALAVLLGASLASLLVNLSFDVGAQTGRELRAYGANVLLLPRGAGLGPGSPGQGGIAERDLAVLDGLPGLVGYVPYLHLVAEAQGQAVVLAGVAFERLRAVSPWWRVEGSWPSAPDHALLGVDLARSLGLTPGDRLTLRFERAELDLVVAGLVEVGGAEDGQAFVSLAAAQTLGGRPGQVGLVEVSALSVDGSPARVAEQIEARLPGVQARTLRRFAQADEAVLHKVRLLIGLVGALVLVAAAVAVGSAMSTSVLERQSEVGLMKALGASERRVAALFLAEGMAIGAAGGAAGYAVGMGLAALVGWQVFRAAPDASLRGLPLIVAMAAAVALVASLGPVRRAMAVDPAVTLRGE